MDTLPSSPAPDPHAVAPDDAVPGAEAPRARGGVWARRFGVAGFLFFLGKGLLWLTLPALLVSLGVGC